ncbi:hypothetical protein H2201_001747 [Coniosporium apollinis]|uniref:Uncharacterized protein n=1 Tax=Coniosporium apollinis TaxID=61459 RepID=A0ABQ9P6C8_9PEZI|nr:hypothetical protein H2201_001747 [Coniosporium apollinis]
MSVTSFTEQSKLMIASLLDFVDALREDPQRDNSGDKLEGAKEAEEPSVERIVLELLRNEAREEAGVFLASRVSGSGNAVTARAAHSGRLVAEALQVGWNRKKQNAEGVCGDAEIER